MKLEQAKKALQQHAQICAKIIRADDNFFPDEKEWAIADITLKAKHGARSIGVARQLLKADTSHSLSEELQESLLCAVMLHDIGDFYCLLTKPPVWSQHAQIARDKLIEINGLNPEKPEDFIILKSIEQHSALKPEMTGKPDIDYAIKFVRDVDFLDDAFFIIQDIFGASRAIYFSSKLTHGPLNPKNLEAFRTNNFVLYADIHTFGDAILLYGAKKATLGLDVSKQLWSTSGLEQKFLDAAYESERRGKLQIARIPYPRP